jgi:Sec-independent protein translocase protein (TatC)
MRRLKPIGHEERLPVVGHLDELRSRLVVALVAFVVAFGLTTWQSELVIELLNTPLPGDREPITLGPTEPFITTLKLSAYAAILIALPVLLYQAYAFLVPALGPRERRLAVPLLTMVPLLFLAGVAFDGAKGMKQSSRWTGGQAAGSGRTKPRMRLASREPTRGLEPLTPSLPWRCSTG